MLSAALAHSAAAAGWPGRPAAPRLHARTPAAALRPARRVALPPARSQSDKEAAAEAAREAAAGAPETDFSKLASEAAGLLASEFGEPQTLDKLAKWLTGGSRSEEEPPEALPPRTDQIADESDAKKLLRQAAEHYGVPTTMGGAIDSVKHWLSGPSTAEQSEHGDAQMVAHLLHRLLERYEREHGEEFEGREGQYDRLYSLASSLLGSSMSKTVLTRLVRAYLRV
ncbi:hypothetical protein ABPG75_007793 [Micractinium tetrahymenae]